ncbi:hypothetical protein [Bacillus subtilis]
MSSITYSHDWKEFYTHMFTDKQSFVTSFKDRFVALNGKSFKEGTEQEVYQTLATMVREQAISRLRLELGDFKEIESKLLETFLNDFEHVHAEQVVVKETT